MSDELRKAARELLRLYDEWFGASTFDYLLQFKIKALRASLDEPEPSREPNTPDADAIVDEYADEYEWDDGETHHVPTGQERILLADFGHGLVSLLHENGLLAPRLLTSPVEPSREPTQEMIEAWEAAACEHAYGLEGRATYGNWEESENARLRKLAALAYAAGHKAGSGT
jgi:hypothetical protein